MFNPLYNPRRRRTWKNSSAARRVTWAGNSGSERKVLYLTAEKFMYGFVAALKNPDRAGPSRKRCAASTWLVIDDLQFLQGKIDPGRILPTP